MNQKIKDAVMASFVADALSLGVHWVYSTIDIKEKYGRLEQMTAPELAPYHKMKQKGEFTHYGDQMMVLLESVTKISGFDLIDFADAWQEMFSSYKGYFDHATKETMENFKAGKDPGKSGSLSADLGGAARIAPLLLLYEKDPDFFADNAKIQTAMTHNHNQVIASAELFARSAALILNGLKPSLALDQAFGEIDNASVIQQKFRAGFESRSEDTCQAIGRFGQMCSTQAALPSTIHLIVKYEDNLKEALIENIMAGGDSAARGMLTGFILGCYNGLDSIPDQWFKDMKAHEKILNLLK